MNEPDEVEGHYSAINRIGIVLGAMLWILVMFGTFFLLKERASGTS